jgi:hypothetical protein
MAPVAAHQFRWPFDGAGEVESRKTACASLPYIDTINQASGFVGTYASPSTMLVYQFRQPLRAAIYLKRTTANAVYNAYFNTGTTSAPFTTSNITGAVPVAFSYFQAASLSNAPHTQYLYTGSVGQNADSFVWMGVGDILTVTPSTSITATLMVYKCVNPGCDQPEVVPVQSLAYAWSGSSSAGTVTATANDFGYFCFRFYVSGPVTLSATLTVVAGDVLCHVPAPNAMAHPSWLNNVRLLGSSILLANEADEIAKNGNVVAAEVNDTNYFLNYNSQQTISALAGSFSGPAAKGCYGWLKPGGRNVFAFRQCMETAGATVTDTNFRLDDASTYNAYAVSVTNLAGLNFLVALHINLEFFTSDVWAGSDYSNLSTTACTEVLQLVVHHNTFVHNPVHAADIRRFVSGTIKFLRQHSLLVGKLITTAFPGTAPIVRPLAELAQI